VLCCVVLCCVVLWCGVVCCGVVCCDVGQIYTYRHTRTHARTQTHACIYYHTHTRTYIYMYIFGFLIKNIIYSDCMIRVNLCVLLTVVLFVPCLRASLRFAPLFFLSFLSTLPLLFAILPLFLSVLFFLVFSTDASANFCVLLFLFFFFFLLFVARTSAANVQMSISQCQ